LNAPPRRIFAPARRTAAAVVRGGRTILSSVVHSQASLHAVHGGVVPEIAGRSHLEQILPVIDAALAKAEVDLDAIAGGEPANAAAAYRQAAAEELLLERENALAVMRRAGVQVVDVAPASLGPAVVEKYLDVKARSLV